ncbi:MAG: FtsW/RodA/SpoVE family cell cycle protein [Alphaproteobacteria bacterium]
MLNLSRTDHSVVGRWWWTTDRWLLGLVGVLILYGAMMVATASPPVAERIGLDSFYFVRRHLMLLIPTLFIMLSASILPPRGVLLLAAAMFIPFLLLTWATPFIGEEIKGARRWIGMGGLSVQPSEFLKPAIIVLSAWFFSKKSVRVFNSALHIPGFLVAMLCLMLVLAGLMRQPDLGMSVVTTLVWGTQFFLAGLPIILMVVMGFAAAGGLVAAYTFFPHVTSRIDRFLNPESGDTFQIDRSLAAFANGGLFGVGPGQGTVKQTIPDAHADFIFSVAGEEMGLFATLFLVLLFVFIFSRGVYRLLQDQDVFVVLAGSGLLMQFIVQALIHMGSALHLLPTKGITLPFVSYGGSSLIALGLGMGMLLALTRKRYMRE